MIYLSDLKKVDKDKYSVGLIHYKPFDKNSGLDKTIEELEKEGVLVKSLPKEEHFEGKVATLYFDYVTEKAWYEYKDAPKKETQLLEERMQLTEDTLLDLMLGGA